MGNSLCLLQEGNDFAHVIWASGDIDAWGGLERLPKYNGLCSETEPLKEGWKIFVKNEYTGVKMRESRAQEANHYQAQYRVQLRPWSSIELRKLMGQ